MLTQARLKELFSYDPETGLFTRIIGRKGVAAGSIAGTPLFSGHIKISIDHRQYLAHRLAWLWMHGYFPEGILDHANGDPADNRIENLRMADPQKNAMNSKRPSSNRSGVKGVCWHKDAKKWMVQVRTPAGKYQGLYESLEEAKIVADRARTEWHEDFARHS